VAAVRNYIGTSGWSYPHWVGRFYPPELKAEQHLRFYAEHFDTVEVNNSFYHLLAPGTVETWVRTVGPEFTFAVKGSRFTTHMKKLKDPVESSALFFESIEGFGATQGPVLYQLPPRWKKNLERLDTFLGALPRRYRYTIELRDQSWIDAEVLELLRRHNAAFCIYELASYESPLHVTADFVYVRLHGPLPEKYAGSYSEAQLRRWRDQIREWNTAGLPVYCYFDNDQAAYAVDNALRLKELLGTQGASAG
jgi:uncharacterized protein YecE (DUF72 family)